MTRFDDPPLLVRAAELARYVVRHPVYSAAELALYLGARLARVRFGRAVARRFRGTGH